MSASSSRTATKIFQMGESYKVALVSAIAAKATLVSNPAISRSFKATATITDISPFRFVHVPEVQARASDSWGRYVHHGESAREHALLRRTVATASNVAAPSHRLLHRLM
jgi:hypothetical protein